MDYNFTHAVNHADKYEKEEMLGFLLSKMSGTGSFLDEAKAQVFIQNMNKYSLEELEKRLK